MRAMDDLAYEDLVQGPVVLTFDGHVVEVFTARFGSTSRLVRGMLYVESTGPDRKGRYEVTLRTMTGRRGNGTTLTIAGADWTAVQPWIAELQAALA
jgi:hypothetical protein